MTVQEMIIDIRREIMADVTPDRAAELLQQLAALLGSVTEQWIGAEMEYNRLYAMMTEQYEKVTEAKARAKASSAYEQKLLAEGQIEVVREMINSLKYTIKTKLHEYGESKYQ